MRRRWSFAKRGERGRGDIPRRELVADAHVLHNFLERLLFFNVHPIA